MTRSLGWGARAISPRRLGRPLFAQVFDDLDLRGCVFDDEASFVPERGPWVWHGRAGPLDSGTEFSVRVGRRGTRFFGLPFLRLRLGRRRGGFGLSCDGLGTATKRFIWSRETFSDRRPKSCFRRYWISTAWLSMTPARV